MENKKSESINDEKFYKGNLTVNYFRVQICIESRSVWDFLEIVFTKQFISILIVFKMIYAIPNRVWQQTFD